MFNYKNGVKIAKIIGGSDDGKTIYLQNNCNEPSKELSKEFKEKYKSLSLSEVRELYSALRSDIQPKTNKLQKIFLEAKEDMKPDENGSFNSLKLKGGKIQVLPRKDIVEKVYISGVSGSGKSTYTGKYLDEFVKIFPDDPIYIFSSVPEDGPLDKHDPIRIPIDDSLIDDPLVIHDFENSITVFDDTDTIQNIVYKSAVNAIKAEMIEIGRHYNARCIVTSHMLSNYRETRQILNEATSVTFFPKSSGVYHIRQFLKKHAGLDKKQIEKLLKIPTRWITLYRCYPSYLVWERGICLLSEFE